MSKEIPLLKPAVPSKIATGSQSRAFSSAVSDEFPKATAQIEASLANTAA